MPSASTSTFISPSASMSSLSHSMKVRSFIAALWIGTVSISRILGQHEPADMLRQMTRKFEQLVDQPLQPRDFGIVEREAGLREPRSSTWLE